MPEGWLDFEEPLAEVLTRIQELGAIGAKDEVARLRDQAAKFRKKLYANLTPWQRVQLARHPRRPHAVDYIERICADFVELHGDRAFGDDPAIVAGLCRIDDIGFMVIGQEKGRDTRDRVRRNFGSPHPEGYRKALRLAELARRFDLPVLSLVDTAGAYPGIGAEERGQAEAIARNLREFAVLETPVLVVVTGEGGSGGALAIAVGDRVLMQENATYSVITPEGCASILWRDNTRAPEAAKALRMTAGDLLEFGVIDEVVPEPSGGAHQDWDEAAQFVKRAVMKSYTELLGRSGPDLVSARVERLRGIGVYAA